MCYYSVISQRPFKIAQLSSIKARPTLSINRELSLPSLPSPLPSSPSTPSNMAHSRLNGSQKFAQQRSDAAARTNKGSFTLDELIKRQVGGKTCFFFFPRKTIGLVVCKESAGETFLIDKRGTFSCFQGLGLKTDSCGATWSHVFQNQKSVEALPQPLPAAPLCSWPDKPTVNVCFGETVIRTPWYRLEKRRLFFNHTCRTEQQFCKKNQFHLNGKTRPQRRHCNQRGHQPATSPVASLQETVAPS